MTMLLAFNSLAAVGICDWWCGAWTPLAGHFIASWLLWHVWRWEGLEELELVSRWRRVAIQSPSVARGLHKKSQLNLKYICFFCLHMWEARLPRTWTLFWYSYCSVLLSNFPFFGSSFFICNMIKTLIQGALSGNLSPAISLWRLFPFWSELVLLVRFLYI